MNHSSHNTIHNKIAQNQPAAILSQLGAVKEKVGTIGYQKPCHNLHVHGAEREECQHAKVRVPRQLEVTHVEQKPHV